MSDDASRSGLNDAVDDDEQRREADEHPEHGVEPPVASRIAPSTSGAVAESV